MNDTQDRGTAARGTATRLFPLALPLTIAIGYYLGAQLGFALTLAPVAVSPLWPPNATLLAGLLLTSPRHWPLVLTAVLPAHLAVQLQTGVPALMIACWYVSNCSEALLGAFLVRRFVGSTPLFETFRSTALFFGCAGFTAPFLSSFLDAAFVVANDWGDAGYWTIWRVRFFANMLTALTLVPVILTSAGGLARIGETPRRTLLEAVGGLTALAAVCWVVFVEQRPGPGTSPALLYTPVPILVAAAIRFGPWGASVSVLACALIAIWGAVLGQGPFVNSSALDNALSIQLFLIVAWIPVMSLAAVIRERAHADEKARTSEEQLAMAVDAAQLGRWEWDFTTGRLMWSDATRRLYELPPDAPVTPDTFDALVHPHDRPLLAAATADALSGRDVDVEFRIRVPDGRIKWIHSKGKTVYDEAGHPLRMVGVKADVTVRKSAELHILEQQRELSHLSRVSVAGELSIAIAHEVNQPLAAILANAGAARRFLRHDPPDLRELREIVEAIADDNRRAAAVITRFGALLNKGEARRTRLGINDVVASVLDIARGDLICRGASLTRQFGTGLPPVLGDAGQLQQVLLNLIVNACDAMECIPAEERRLVVSTAGHGEHGVRVAMSDSGPGVLAEGVERIFEPFVTSNTRRLGLGLAICRSIVAAHGGHLSIENEPGRGATFSFILPAARTTQGTERESAPAAAV